MTCLLYTSRHEYLESQVAEFVGKPDAFLLNFGDQGMVSIIDAMTSRHDCIVYDAEDHACIMDGLRLSPAKRYVYPVSYTHLYPEKS